MTKSKYPKETKLEAISRYQDKKEPVVNILRDLNIPKTTFYDWLRAEGIEQQKSSKLHYQHQYDRIRHLENVIAFLKEAECSPSDHRIVKMKEMEKFYGKYDVRVLCDAKEVSRGTFYNYMLRNKRDDVWYINRRKELKPLIVEVYNESEQRFGSKKIATVLQSRGVKVSDKVVRDICKELGLTSIRKGSKKLFKKDAEFYKNKVNRQFNPDAPNQVWVTDVTYLKHKNMTLYLCVILDLFSRKVISYKIGKRNSSALTKSTLLQAYQNRSPKKGLIIHSDRGTNYTSDAYNQCVIDCNMIHSFSKKATPHDNAAMESFFSTLKREEFYRYKYKSEKELRESISKYIDFYNAKRPHATLNYRTPCEYEDLFFNRHKL